MSDAINPDHYRGFSNGTEVIDITENLTFNGGNAVKYAARATRRDGNNKGNIVEDLKKARWYIDREIDRVTVLASEPAVTPAQIGKALARIYNELDPWPTPPRTWDRVEDIPPGVKFTSNIGLYTYQIDGDRKVSYTRRPGEFPLTCPDYLDTDMAPFKEVV